MKVADLMDELETFDPNAEVHFSYNYGDHWRTQVAPKVRGIEEGYVIHSDYHSMPKVTDEGNEKATKVVVIS